MSHTHGPGQPAHSHSHGPPQPGPQQQQQQPYVPPPQPDPKLQALIEADFKRVDLKLTEENKSKVLCVPHSKEKCDECGVDFVLTNRLSAVFAANVNLNVPPPPNIVQPQRTQAVNKTKEQGNNLLKAKKTKEAIGMYTMAANVAMDRFPWENGMLMKEELATVLSNRSAAFFIAEDYVGSLVDADLVVQLKKPWAKGHFRKAKALAEMGQMEDARDAIKLGLAFEPNNTELQQYLNELESRISKKA